MEKIRLAILGTGSRGAYLGTTYAAHPQTEVVAMCDIADNYAANAAAQLKEKTGQEAKIFTSYEEMVKNSAYDAILIACDPDIQVQYAVEEMNRGIHVMTEVPAAYTIDQCWDLVNTVKKTGAKYQLAEQTRYWHFIAQWRKMVAEGKIGKVFYAEGEYLHYEKTWDYFRNKKTGARIWTADPSYHNNPDWETTWRYRAFMDPIWYLPHELSPLLSITGGRIEKVSCLGTRQGSYCHEGFATRDLECALMYNSNDTIFSLRAGFTAPYGRKAHTSSHWYQLKGSEGSLEWARSTDDVGKMYTREEGWSNHPEWGCADPTRRRYSRMPTTAAQTSIPSITSLTRSSTIRRPPWTYIKPLRRPPLPSWRMSPHGRTAPFWKYRISATPSNPLCLLNREVIL